MARDKAMATASKTLRTRHINCFFCIAVSFFTLAVVLFALSSEESKVLGTGKSRAPVIVSASVILILSIVIVIWNTYYAVRYFRLKKHQHNHRVQTPASSSGSINTPTAVVVFDNAAFSMDDPLTIDPVTNVASSRWWTKEKRACTRTYQTMLPSTWPFFFIERGNLVTLTVVARFCLIPFSSSSSSSSCRVVILSSFFLLPSFSLARSSAELAVHAFPMCLLRVCFPDKYISIMLSSIAIAWD